MSDIINTNVKTITAAAKAATAAALDEPDFLEDGVSVSVDVDPRAAYNGEAILAAGRTMCTDTWKTGLNNNMLVVGATGSGKTRYVLKPNVLQGNGSIVVLDTKGSLYDELGDALHAMGYAYVERVDFTELGVGVGWNPLEFVRRNPATGAPKQVDILSIASAICPVENGHEPFWDHAAENYLSCFIAYVLEQLPPAEQTMASVLRLMEGMADGTTDHLLDQLDETARDSMAAQLYRRLCATETAEKMHASILGILAEKTRCIGFDEAVTMFTKPTRVDFARLGRERCALFVTVSDIDRALDPLASLFIGQAFHALLRSADHDYADKRLPVPVHFYLDDFANLRIEHFADLLSVMRSREVSATLFCQTLTQLEAAYGEAEAGSIVGNCDVQLLLACQDVSTADHFAAKANVARSTILQTPLGTSWLFVRGSRAEKVKPYPLEQHPNFWRTVRPGGHTLALDADVPPFDDELPF